MSHVVRIADRVERKKSLSQLSTFAIGGPASFFISVQTVQEMQEALAYAKSASLNTLVIGKGSNILFPDEGFQGLVIQNKIDFLETDGEGLFIAGAGFSFTLLGQRTAREGFTGLEFAAGIPATVGGAVFMNAGAQNQETKNSLVWVDHVGFDGHLQRYLKESVRFGYRHSDFQHMPGAIVSAAFKLTRDPGAYAAQRNLIDYRLKTQPYKDKSCGCIFRNPTHKSAGALIEQAGLKGLCVGGAQVSTLHANFIVNTGGATASDVLKLMKEIKQRVYHQTGIQLESEVRVVDSPRPD